MMKKSKRSVHLRLRLRSFLFTGRMICIAILYWAAASYFISFLIDWKKRFPEAKNIFIKLLALLFDAYYNRKQGIKKTFTGIICDVSIQNNF